MFGQEPKILRWTSKAGNQISRSIQHKGMYLVTTPDGGWYSIASSEDVMLRIHEPLLNTIVQ